LKQFLFTNGLQKHSSLIFLFMQFWQNEIFYLLSDPNVEPILTSMSMDFKKTQFFLVPVNIYIMGFKFTFRNIFIVPKSICDILSQLNLVYNNVPLIFLGFDILRLG
jgi:hypothetical protein